MSWCLLATVAALAIGGCAVPRRSVVVLPLDVVGDAHTVGEGLRRALVREVQRRTGAAVLAGRGVDEAVARPECADRQTRRCAVLAGRRVGATEVLGGAVAGLGRTYVVQLQTVDVQRDVVIHRLEETFFGGEAALAATPAMTERLFADLTPTPAPTRRWHHRWWVWTAVGVVVAVAVVTPLVVRRHDSGYERIPLP